MTNIFPITILALCVLAAGAFYYFKPATPPFGSAGGIRARIATSSPAAEYEPEHCLRDLHSVRLARHIDPSERDHAHL
jgi:hypothetical protein